MSHQEKITRITTKLRVRSSESPLKFIKKRTVSHQVPKKSSVKIEESIDISDLNEILEISPQTMTCVAEPGVSFATLVKETLRYNLVPIIVPELKNITLGGAIAGCSVESASFMYGGFHDTCLEYEVITPQGVCLICTKTNEHADVFSMIHGTFGTIGIITKITFQLIPAKKYVHLIYKTYTTFPLYQDALQEHCEKKEFTYIDGIIHSPTKYVLCLGNFIEKAPFSHTYTLGKPFYHSTAELSEDFIETYDYFFRYDADCHRISRNYGLENPLLRFLFGKFFLGSKKMLTRAKKLQFFFENKKPDVVLDVFIPFSRFASFMSFYQEKFAYYPLWVVPYRISIPYPWVNATYISPKDELYVDLAIYGFKQKGNMNYYRLLEKELMKLQGIKTLISYNYYTEEEFRSIWNKDAYQKVKKKTDPYSMLGDMYTKTHT